VGIVLVVLLAAMIYVETYYHAAPEAIAALSSSDQIQVSKTGDGWFFDGPSETAALIFYPGGKVEETAYAPFLKRLAEKGYRTVGEMFHLDETFSTYKRNKNEDYKATVDRASIEAEAKLIFAKQ
jgi:CRISPR/Cas system Type II protein with McrA/HNH and RuvC-like nuclease domain